MKAIHCTQYGDVEHLKILEVEKPAIGKDEVLVQVATTTVQTADWRVRTLTMPAGMTFFAKIFFGFNKMKQPILGTEFAGRIVSVGESVTRFKVGDDIVATTGAKFGAHAEFSKVSENGVVLKKPSRLTFQEIVCLPFGGLTALDFLKYRVKVKPNQNVLVVGASGAVGTAAIQISKILGANVIAVCSYENQHFVKSLGADQVIDYARTKFWEESSKYDVIFDAVGNLETSKLLNSLHKNGKLVLVSASLWQMLTSALRNFFSKQEIFSGVIEESPQRLAELVRLVELGKYKPVIGKEYAFQDIVEAHKCVQSRHKRGNVVINVNSSIQ
tara:strand:- start:8928 stop:9914 length:987 start_codon:yes stop_codon:yes gene_type:complete